MVPIEAFFGTKRLFKTQFFEKKAMILAKQKLLPNFSHRIEEDKRQGTIHSGLQYNMTTIVYATI